MVKFVFEGVRFGRERTGAGSSARPKGPSLCLHTMEGRADPDSPSPGTAAATPPQLPAETVLPRIQTGLPSLVPQGPAPPRCQRLFQCDIIDLCPRSEARGVRPGRVTDPLPSGEGTTSSSLPQSDNPTVQQQHQYGAIIPPSEKSHPQTTPMPRIPTVHACRKQ